MRVILDTNVLIDGFQDDYNAPSRLLDVIIDGDLEAVASSRVEKEYRLIERRLIHNPGYESRLNDFFTQLQGVKPIPVDVVIDDQEDLKFIEAAVGGNAEYIVTSDKHLLDIGEVDNVRIVTPVEAWRIFEDSSGGKSEWQNFMRSLGVGK